MNADAYARIWSEATGLPLSDWYEFTPEQRLQFARKINAGSFSSDAYSLQKP